MSREAFFLLLDALRSELSNFDQDDEAKEIAFHRSGKATEAATKLAVFIRVMAGGRPYDISLAFDVGSSTVYAYTDTVLNAVINSLRLCDMPSNEEQCRKASMEFCSSRPYVNPLPGCIAALDGITIELEKPANEYNPGSFMCRKGYYAFPVQALVNSDYKFIAISAFCSGATHDSLAMQM